MEEKAKDYDDFSTTSGIGTRVLLFGGELQPSDRFSYKKYILSSRFSVFIFYSSFVKVKHFYSRGHEGAGAFSNDTQATSRKIPQASS